MKITVSKKDSETAFDTEDGEKILYAGLRQGLALPHECGTGTCGSCKATLKSGQLHSLWNEAPGAKNCKAGRNEFLMCQSTALADCEISFRGSLEQKRKTKFLPDYYKGKITGTKMLTKNVLGFKVLFDRVLPFSPGQFVVMSVDGLEGGRAYSMVNNGAHSDELEFVVKHAPGGGFSRWVFDEPREDAEVSVFGPLGCATLDLDENRDLLCITGGSGIAGIVSLLTQAVHNNYFDNNRGHLFFGIRTYQDLFFHNRLVGLCKQSNGNLKVSFAFSDGSVPKKCAEKLEGVEYLEGKITPLAMQQLGSSVENPIVFLAGPPPMVDDAIRRLVMDAGFSVDDIRYDKFG